MPRFQIRRFITAEDEMTVNARNSAEAYTTAKELLDENTGNFETAWNENFQIQEISVAEDIQRLQNDKELARLKADVAPKAQPHAPQPPKAVQPAKPVAKTAPKPVDAKPAKPVIPAAKVATAPVKDAAGKVMTREDLYKLAKSKGLAANTKMNVAKLTALLATAPTTPTKG